MLGAKCSIKGAAPGTIHLQKRRPAAAAVATDTPCDITVVQVVHTMRCDTYVSAVQCSASQTKRSASGRGVGEIAVRPMPGQIIRERVGHKLGSRETSLRTVLVLAFWARVVRRPWSSALLWCMRSQEPLPHFCGGRASVFPYGRERVVISIGVPHSAFVVGCGPQSG